MRKAAIRIPVVDLNEGILLDQGASVGPASPCSARSTTSQRGQNKVFAASRHGCENMRYSWQILLREPSQMYDPHPLELPARSR